LVRDLERRTCCEGRRRIRRAAHGRQEPKVTTEPFGTKACDRRTSNEPMACAQRPNRSRRVSAQYHCFRRQVHNRGFRTMRLEHCSRSRGLTYASDHRSANNGTSAAGPLVTMPSAPSASRRAAVSTSSTVQKSTRTPRAWQRAMNDAVSNRSGP
jgi:hypothetical protein